MQMLVVAMILPSLLLMSPTKAYPALRAGGALFAGVAATGWIMERFFDIQTPVDRLVNAIGQDGVWFASAIVLTSLLCRYLTVVEAHKRTYS
jgi:hypothetical protein